MANKCTLSLTPAQLKQFKALSKQYDGDTPKVMEEIRRGLAEKRKAATQGAEPTGKPTQQKTTAEDPFPKEALDKVVKQLEEIEIPANGSMGAIYRQIITKATRGLSSKYWHNNADDKMAIEYIQQTVMNPIIREIRKGKGTLVKNFEQWHKETQEEYARTLEIDSDELAKTLESHTGDMYDAQTRLMAFEIRLADMYADLLKIRNDPLRAVDAANKRIKEELDVKYILLSEKIAKHTQAAYGLETAKGRILGAGRIDLKKTKDMTSSEIKNVLDSAGNGRFFNTTEDRLKMLDDALDAAEKSGSRQMGLKAVKGFQRYSGADKFMASMTEAWRGMLLTSNSTGSINALSGIIETFVVPAERLIGSSPLNYKNIKKEGGGYAWDPQAKEAFDQTWLHLRYIKQGVHQGLKAFSYAFAHERQSLDPFHGAMIETPGRGMAEATHAELDAVSPFQLTSGNWNLDPKSLLGKVMDVGGKGFRMSFRYLGAQDDLLKHTTYFASLKSKYHTDALRGLNNGQLQADQVDDWIDAQMKGHFQEDGITPKMGADGNIAYDQAALEMAQDITHTKPAWDGTIVKDLQQAVNNNPSLGIFLPFIRTPSDLINKTYQRTPLIGRLSKRLQQDLKSPDPMLRAQAQGRQMVGTMVVFAGVLAAYEGRLTGSGPDDPRLNRVWSMTHQKNSIQVDGKWVSINKLDPIGTQLLMIANGAEAFKNSATTKGNDGWDVVQAMVLAVTATIGDKSTLKGVINMATLFSNEIIGKEEKTENILEDHIASWIPSILTQVSGAFSDDNAVKEASGLIAKIQRKSPWHQGDLPDRYNFITGKKEENPAYMAWGLSTKEFQSDPVMEELANLNHGFSGPTRSIGGADITDAQFSEWSQLMGTTILNGKTLKQELKATMGSRQYDYDPDRTYFRDSEGDDVIQVQMVRAIMRKYKAAAKKRLLLNNPDIAPQDNRQAFIELLGG